MDGLNQKFPERQDAIDFYFHNYHNNNTHDDNKKWISKATDSCSDGKPIFHFKEL